MDEIYDRLWDVIWYQGFHNARNDFEKESQYAEREEAIKQEFIDEIVASAIDGARGEI